MEYEWDETKNAVNRRKHGIGFEAMDGFAWEYALGPEIQYSDGEEREFWVGPIGQELFALALTERENVTRVISLRPASKHEKRDWRRKYSNA